MSHLASADEFRIALRQVTSSVAVITSGDEVERNGLTATAFCSVTLDPPTLLICVNKSASADAIINRTGCFAVNVLTDDHEDVARRFSTSKLEPSERFSRSEWLTLATGAPVLADSAASFDCRVIERHSYTSHDVIFGGVAAVRTRAGDNLLFRDGVFCKSLSIR